MSWLNSWIAAAPLYHQAELQFIQEHRPSKALYARGSRMPAHSESTTTLPNQIAALRRDLTLSEAHDPETRLRVLTILGLLEVNYDSGMARQTWEQVDSRKLRQGEPVLVSPCTLIPPDSGLGSPAARQGVKFLLASFPHWLRDLAPKINQALTPLLTHLQGAA